MALVNGDYITLQTRVVAQLQADSGAGGLYESLGVWDGSSVARRSVNTIEREMLEEPSLYSDRQLPAIVILPDGRASEAGEHPQHFVKTFEYAALIVARDDNYEAADNEIFRIIHRLEKVLREQNSTSNAMGLQDGDIDGQDIGPQAIVELGNSSFARGEDGKGKYSFARLDFTVGVPVTFTYT